MLLKKIKYRISQVVQPILNRSINIKFNWGYWIFTFVCLLSIVLLGINVFRIIKKGYERYEIIQGEKRRLETLLVRNIQLKEDLKYYSSKEFIDVKAREELNLAFPNQRLVYIEDQETLDMFDNEDYEDIENLTPSWHLWYNLIF